MSKYIMAVYSNAVAGRDHEYNQWYNEIHMGEVLQVPGFVAAQRFAVAGDPVRGEASVHKYLAIYELETEDPDACLTALNEAVAGGGMNVSDAISLDDVAAQVYGPITERLMEK